MDKKLIKGEYLEVLLRSSRTIFSTKDVAMLWGEDRKLKVSGRLNKYVQAGKLVRVRRGIYAKDKKYDPLELANRIFIPSYISFETVLTREGINFQYYGNIFVASYVSRDIVIDDNRISFVRMKDYVLTNNMGIENTGNISIATKERAFLDRIYVSKDYHFDNLGGLDWEKVFEILPIYYNKRMIKKVNRYFKHYKATE